MLAYSWSCFSVVPHDSARSQNELEVWQAIRPATLIEYLADTLAVFKMLAFGGGISPARMMSGKKVYTKQARADVRIEYNRAAQIVVSR